MDTQSPYQAPASQTNAQPPQYVETMVPEPAAIRTFGVMHLVIAGLGILQTLYSVFSIVFMDQFAGMMTGGAPTRRTGMPDPSQVMMEMMDKLKWYTYLSMGVGVILIVMLIIAGIGLLKGRENGRVMSLRYAWTSIVTKVMALIYTIVVVVPLSKQMMTGASAGGPPGMEEVMNIVMPLAQIFGVLVTFTYPVIVLIVMNGRRVKDYLSARAL
jgi:hypothetical protein